jgi:hypothetical protein
MVGESMEALADHKKKTVNKINTVWNKMIVIYLPLPLPL